MLIRNYKRRSSVILLNIVALDLLLDNDCEISSYTIAVAK
jgi:hypothetical protein